MKNNFMAPYFRSPDPTKMDYSKYANFIENDLPAETPNIYNLHPNSEIGYLSKKTTILF
jgi:dynein heavy chain